MRVLPIVVLMAAMTVPLAGCLSAERTPSASGDDAVAAGEVPVLPENFTREESVVGSTPLSGLLSASACGGSASGTCYRYEVTLEDPARMTATLSWQMANNDFDLMLLEGDAVLAESDTLPPGTQERLDAALDAGRYQLVVVAYLVSVDTFHLEGVFTSV